MITIERSIKSNLSETDLKVLNEINAGLQYYKGLSQRLSWFNSGFDLKEFTTLWIDFRDFYYEAQQPPNEIYLYHLNSFIKSYKSLLKNYDTHFKHADLMFRHYLIDCIVSMALMVSEIINEIAEAE